jgi:hypothetical protein
MQKGEAQPSNPPRLEDTAGYSFTVCADTGVMIRFQPNASEFNRKGRSIPYMPLEQENPFILHEPISMIDPIVS